ncbi:MAG: GDP-L-fucose synthase [Polyangiaceae bacterium]|nr:GDP-L-fucose synthase [Polyangiaceae bacterium]
MTLDFTGLRIMVTGGAGFLGKSVVKKLADLGASQIIVPRSREVDLTDGHATKKLFAEARPELVFHLAAQVGGIGANLAHPGSFFRDNMAMGLNVLEQGRLSGVKKLVIAGTICAYPKFAPVPFSEDDLWNGYPEETNAPYGVAKKALLVMANAYRQEFGSNYVTLFPVNLYGPGDNFNLESSHVIPAMIRKFAAARRNRESEVELWGDGTPTREFLYVEDAARGLIMAARSYNKPDPVNLGAGFEISMKDLAYKIARLTGFDGTIRWNTSKPNGQPRRMLNTDRAAREFGFRAEVGLDEGLARTVKWFDENRAHAKT